VVLGELAYPHREGCEKSFSKQRGFRQGTREGALGSEVLALRGGAFGDAERPEQKHVKH